MRYRLSALKLTEPFDAKALRPGESDFGQLSEDDGYFLDRIDDTVLITHKGRPELTKAVPWSGVRDATISANQPAWSDAQTLKATLYAKPTISDEDAPQVGAPVFHGQKLDGRTREARAMKAGS